MFVITGTKIPMRAMYHIVVSFRIYRVRRALVCGRVISIQRVRKRVIIVVVEGDTSSSCRTSNNSSSSRISCSSHSICISNVSSRRSC